MEDAKDITPNFFHKMRCVRCGASTLKHSPDFLECSACGERFFFGEGGIPFMGKYAKSDCVALVEIAAVARTVPRRTTPQFENWEHACEKYWELGDDVFPRYGIDRQYFPFRYAEWELWRILLDGIDFGGKSVLDVGAGEGFDSWRFYERGASVAALEYNPVFAAQGKRNLPNIFWVGGFSHLLPFQDESFDFVVCNAALHHMLDIPTALDEFLRVVKPGGYVLTAGDSFSADAASDRDRLRVFDAHEAVLSGVNEQVPPISHFLSPLERHGNALEVEIFTHDVHGADALGLPLMGIRRAGKKDAAKIGAALGGGISMRIRKTHSLDIPAAIQRDGWLDAREVAELSRGEAPEAGIEKIYSAMRDHVAAAGYVNMPLPHPVHDKFLQMAGWRIPEDGAPWQEGWGRVNSFWRRTAEERSLLLELDLPAFADPQGIEGGVKFLLDGVEIGDMHLLRGAWHKVVLPVESAAPGQPFMLTIVADPSPSFDLRRIRFRRGALLSRAAPAGGECAAMEPDDGPGIGACVHFFRQHHDQVAVVWLPQKTPLREICAALDAPCFMHWWPDTLCWRKKELFPRSAPGNSWTPDFGGLSACLGHLAGIKKIIMVPNSALPKKIRDLLENVEDCLILSTGENKKISPCAGSSDPTPKK